MDWMVYFKKMSSTVIITGSRRTSADTDYIPYDDGTRRRSPRRPIGRRRNIGIVCRTRDPLINPSDFCINLCRHKSRRIPCDDCEIACALLDLFNGRGRLDPPPIEYFYTKCAVNI